MGNCKSLAAFFKYEWFTGRWRDGGKIHHEVSRVKTLMGESVCSDQQKVRPIQNIVWKLRKAFIFEQNFVKWIGVSRWKTRRWDALRPEALCAGRTGSGESLAWLEHRGYSCLILASEYLIRIHFPVPTPLQFLALGPVLAVGVLIFYFGLTLSQASWWGFHKEKKWFQGYYNTV